MSRQSFTAWLRERGLDQQRWTSELQRSLRARYEQEQAIEENSGIGIPMPGIESQVAKFFAHDGAIAKFKTDHRLIVDQRGCSWPARVHRVGEVRL